MSKRPRVVLTMIVRNEAKVIRRCLESVIPHIDAWAISDTGSTDGTQELIRAILKDIPGVLIERPWVDFSTNRNEAIDAGLAFEPDWFMTLDADEVFTPGAGFGLDLSCDIHSVMFRMADSNARWPRRVFFRPNLRYRYVLDEVLDDGDSHDVLSACEVVSYPDGARSQDGLVPKFNRDVEVLKRALESEPECPRYWFYLAQRLMGAQRYPEALEAYRKRVSLEGGFEEECARSAFMIGQIREILDDQDRAGIAAQYLAAWQMRPEFAEPLFALAMLHSQDGEHALAELYARAAQRLQRPAAGLPIDEEIYAWKAVDLLAGALAEQGKLNEAAQLLEKLLPLQQLPETERPRVRENIATIRAALPEPEPFIGADEATYLAQSARVKERGLRGLLDAARSYLSSPAQQTLPGPQRWLWILALRWCGAALPFAATLAAMALTWWATSALGGDARAMTLAALSPLALLVGSRVLQDTAVAALTLAGIGAASAGSPWLLGLSVFALASTKETSALLGPALAFAWHCSGAPWVEFAAACGAGGALAALGGIALLRDAWWPALVAGAKSHITPYTQDNQQGAPHRLLADLVLVSPVASLMGLFGDTRILMLAGLILAAHALTPVRNVRTVLAAELLLRASAVTAFGWWALLSIPVDIYISRRLRGVYDPVTGVLARALGMQR